MIEGYISNNENRYKMSSVGKFYIEIYYITQNSAFINYKVFCLLLS